uniref:Uncharacterized protein n=1 Tax=viral metagenome TaxID=1070528 RepID=A0A6C0I2G1_9ZZZZ
MQTASPDSPKPYNPSQTQYSPAPSAPPDNDDDYNAPTAPEITDEELEQLQYRVYDLSLALITSELEYLNGQLNHIQNEITQMDTTKCDKQCQEANKSIESNTVDDILKNINDIFNK